MIEFQIATKPAGPRKPRQSSPQGAKRAVEKDVGALSKVASGNNEADESESGEDEENADKEGSPEEKRGKEPSRLPKKKLVVPPPPPPPPVKRPKGPLG